MVRLISAALLGSVCVASDGARAHSLEIVDRSGNPSPGVKVVIGTAIGQPFAGNQLTTNDNGRIEVPEAWTAPLPVTLESVGFVRTTHYDVGPQTTSLSISAIDGEERIELQGSMSGFGPLKTDGKVDVGAFMPAIPKRDLLYFDIGWMVSPEIDRFSVIGRDVAVPSNIVLPRQSETYIFPITLEKPNFRMYVRKPGHYRFLALHGQFPLQRVVDDMRSGKPPYDILNHASLIESGLVDLDVTDSARGLSIPVNSMPFSNTFAAQAPSLNSDDVMLTVALTHLDGALIPSDVKRLRSGQSQTLKIPVSNSAPTAVSVLLKEKPAAVTWDIFAPVTAQDVLNVPYDLLYRLFGSAQSQTTTVDFKQLSLATHPLSGAAPQFLRAVSSPRIQGTSITLVPPPQVAGIEPTGMLLVYSAIKFNGSGQLRTESRTRIWELWLPSWSETVNLPNLPALSPQAADKMRWEVLYLGRNPQINPGTDLTDVSHVSRNALDL